MYMRVTRKKPIQIYIEPRQDAALTHLARRKRVSKAEIIRESLESYLREIPLEDDPAMGILHLGESERKDLSERHDEYIARYARQKTK
jgi:hypothetical protein